MTIQSVSKILKANPWFDGLSDGHFKSLLSIAKEVRWLAGKVIFREGEIATHIYLIIEGHVALEMSVPSRGKKTILTVGRDDVFGWSSVVPVVGIKTTSARSIQDTHAIGFDAPALRKECELDHELGYLVYRRLTNVIAARLSETRLQLLDMYGDDYGGSS
ncbi:MAG: Crp/Fnr family transcriptional regulator [Anaerolineales bacterium]